MNSSQNNKSSVELINWNTPEMDKDHTFRYNNENENYVNNPFDLLELKAAHNSIDKNIELNSIKHVDNFMKDQLNNDHFTIYKNEDIIIKSKEEDCIEKNKDFNKVENKYQTFDLALISNHNEIEKENLCNEEDKNLIIKQTRQKIQMFIEKEKENYSKRNLSNSIFCTPQRNCYELSINKTDNSLNRGFMQFDSNNSSNNFNISLSNISDINELFTDQDISYEDLNLIKPEWPDEELIDFDESPKEFRINKSMPIIGLPDSDVNNKLQILSIGNIKSNQNVIQIDKDDQFQEISRMKPVASSTPTLEITIPAEICLSEKLQKSKCNLLLQSISDSIDSPKTPLNVTKCIKEKSNNATFLFTADKKNTTLMKRSFQVDKSKSESSLERIPRTMLLNKKRISGLPILKGSTMPFKGKNNVKPQ